MLNSDDRRLGRDLFLPSAPDGSVSVTPTGDLRDVAGRDNLEQAIRNRALALPGSLVHRPGYGAGLPLYVEEAGTPATRARMATEIRRQALQDPRVGEARASVTAGDGHQVSVQLHVRVRGDLDEQQITVVSEE